MRFQLPIALSVSQVLHVGALHRMQRSMWAKLYLTLGVRTRVIEAENDHFHTGPVRIAKSILISDNRTGRSKARAPHSDKAPERRRTRTMLRYGERK
jgi:hypothetical protein